MLLHPFSANEDHRKAREWFEGDEELEAAAFKPGSNLMILKNLEGIVERPDDDGNGQDLAA